MLSGLRPATQPRPLVRVLDLATMTKPQLTAVYNHLSDFKVESFRLYSTALRRVDFLLDKTGMAVVDHDTGAEGAAEVIPNVWVVPADTIPSLEVPPRSETRWKDEYIITMNIAYNPKKEHSASWLRWRLMEDGQTIGEYLDACEREGYGRKWRGDVIWALERDYISLTGPDGPVLLPPPVR